MSRRLTTIGLWAGLLAGTPLLLLSQPAEKAVRQGIAVELSLQRADGQPGPVREGDSARVSLAFSDAATGTPLAGVKPGAWLDFLGSGPDAGAECRQKAESFLGGSLFARPELDLNVYYVLSLNQDATISVVDPLFGYGGSKLLAMVFLESPGEDWALTPSGHRLFVSLPDAGRVAVIESADWKVALGIDTPPRPRRLGLQPDGQYLWVAWDGADPQLPSGVSVIDVRSLRPVARLETGRGGHDLAFSDDSRFVFVTNEADATVSVIDVAQLAKVRDVRVGSRPVSIAWSSQA
ncbi:MAG TPA: YncE family protein, partial [Thermoanaerobaculia bacterium]|nr:YncE family protein [Thermoanaerobaculia bacterium]